MLDFVTDSLTMFQITMLPVNTATFSEFFLFSRVFTRSFVACLFIYLFTFLSLLFLLQAAQPDISLESSPLPPR
jgi:hypothetical protein